MLTQSFISSSFHSDKIEPDLGLTDTTNGSSQLKFRKPTLSPSSGSVMTTLLFLVGRRVISEP